MQYHAIVGIFVGINSKWFYYIWVYGDHYPTITMHGEVLISQVAKIYGLCYYLHCDEVFFCGYN